MNELSQPFQFLPLDAEIVQWLNSLMGASPRFDRILHALNGNPILTGLPFVAAVWWLGANQPRGPSGHGGFLTRSIAGLLCALLAARLLQTHGPLHLRPIADPALHLTSFTDNDPNYFRKLNSFPSDHAVEFFALSLAIFSRHARLGAAAAGWSLVFICLPRVYFGYHYPSDILAGAILGAAVMAAFLIVPVPGFIDRLMRRLEQRCPGAPRAAQFLISAECAVNFDHIRDLLTVLGWV